MKVNRDDYLYLQSLDRATRHKNVAEAENDEFVQRMRIPADASDVQIQRIISGIVSKNQFCARPDSTPSSVKIHQSV